VFLDGGAWSTPKPIQGRGRFDVDKAILTLTPSGRLVVSAEVHHQFSPEDRYLGVQVFEKSRWSRLSRLEQE